jgi:hypothetical protein
MYENLQRRVYQCNVLIVYMLTRAQLLLHVYCAIYRSLLQSGMNFSAYVANTSANTSAQAVSQPGTTTTAATATSAASADRASKHKPLLGDAKLAANGKPNGNCGESLVTANKVTL